MFLSGLIYIYQLDSVDTEKLVQRDNSWSGATLASAVIASKNPYSSACVSYQSSPCAESLAHSPESQEIVVVGEIHAYNRVTQCGCCKSRAAGSGNSRTNQLINLPFSRKKKSSLPAGSGLVWLGLAHPPRLIEQVGRGSPLDHTFSFTFYSGRML